VGKSRDKKFRGDIDSNDEAVFIAVEDIHLPDETLQRLRRDDKQIQGMRRELEAGRELVPVVVHHRFGGGYNVRDGRHRVLAARIAGVSHIAAWID